MKELCLQRKLKMRSSNRDGSTQVAHLNRKKSLFCLSAPDSAKGDSILELQLFQPLSTGRGAPVHTYIP